MKNKNLKKFSKLFKGKKKIKNKNVVLSDKLYKAEKKANYAKKRKSIGVKFSWKKKKKIPKKYIPILLIFVVVTSVIISVIFLGPIFRVKTIEVVKKDDVTEMNIAYKSLDNFRGKSIFYVEPQEILERLQSYQENIQNIQVKKRFPDTLEITIDSYKKLFNTIISGKNYVVLENGALIPKLHDENLLDMYVVNNFKVSTFFDYRKIFPEVFMRKIEEILQKVQENLPGVEISEIHYYVDERELHIMLGNSTLLFFSLADDISVEEQIRNLAVFNKDYKNLQDASLVYVDFRIKNKSYYCEKETVRVCERNLSYLYPKIEKRGEAQEDTQGSEEKPTNP